MKKLKDDIYKNEEQYKQQYLDIQNGTVLINANARTDEWVARGNSYVDKGTGTSIEDLTNADVDKKRQTIVDEASYWMGKVPYKMPSSYNWTTDVLVKNSPPTSLDCSDFTAALYATKLNIRFPDYTGNQLNVGSEVDISKAKSGDYSNLKPGDLVIFDWPVNGYTRDGDHVGVYVGGGNAPDGSVYPTGAFIHESSGGKNIVKASLDQDWGNKYGVVHNNIMSVRRVIK